jgi:ATP-dependent DNA helicase RecG
VTTAASASQTNPALSQPVMMLRGVGRERSELFKRLEILSIEDLLLHRPRRYEDRRQLRKIAELQLHELGLARGTIVALGVKWFRHHTQSIFELILDDGTARLHCRWWNLPFMEKNFEAGQEVVVCGKLKENKPRGMDHPETEIVEAGAEASIHLNRITPIYPLTEGISQRWLRGLIFRTLDQFGPELDNSSTTLGLDPFASGLPSRPRAIRNLHFPEELTETEPARRRLAFDEFLRLQLQIQARRKNFETKARALPCRGDNHLMKPFLSQLGFRLTESQTAVLRELRADMSAAHPMRRLLQGDVGCGKTVVAACCALMALESGYDAALMAPTEILAEQHFANFNKWFEPLGINIQLVTGSSHPMRQTEPATGNPRRQVTLSIGTHALIQSGFAPLKLGLVIIDEQHRFGVAQREQLVRKGSYPHLLVMTATPIPRTLGLTLYGELDVSVIAAPPSGRGRINTFIRQAEKLPQVWSFIKTQLRAGRQAYVVYPRVEETGDTGLKAVIKEFGNLQTALKPHRIGLIHGRVRSDDKERVMEDFRGNRVQVLLATSLIEVGVDVPNATIMLIENAEQFGLAQLHQLRGRIGRGSQDSYCILMAAAKSKEAQQRLRIMEQTSDGFQIAEADLKLRGPGELLGQQQSGLPKFKFGDLITDLDLIKQARDAATQVLAVSKPMHPQPRRQDALRPSLRARTLSS